MLKILTALPASFNPRSSCEERPLALPHTAIAVTYCEEISVGLDNATFEDKRKYFDWLQVRGKLAVENNEKVIYAKCRIGEQRLSVVATSP